MEPVTTPLTPGDGRPAVGVLLPGPRPPEVRRQVADARLAEVVRLAPREQPNLAGQVLQVVVDRRRRQQDDLLALAVAAAAEADQAVQLVFQGSRTARRLVSKGVGDSSRRRSGTSSSSDGPRF